ncbi:MAG: histidine kinase [Elusimicrobia bacterium RIFOXYC2_FULL_34_12]|nr:MAG: histidine kinase [Elusimicrobia bacterium RIFOXYC2_FULL_34_12]
MALKKNINKTIEALTKISEAITSELFLDDILKLIVTVTAELFGFKICSLMLLNDNGELVIRSSQAVSDEYLKKPPLKIGEGLAGMVVKEKKPCSIYDIYQDKLFKYKEIARKEGLCSVLCIPLIVKNRVIGAIDVYTSFPHEFTDKEENVLITIANQAAVVIENTELIVKTKVFTEELESRKLIERAKGILMKNDNLTEEDAYKMIQKLSMNKRKTMKEIAEAVMIVEDLKK